MRAILAVGHRGDHCRTGQVLAREHQLASAMAEAASAWLALLDEEQPRTAIGDAPSADTDTDRDAGPVLDVPDRWSWFQLPISTGNTMMSG